MPSVLSLEPVVARAVETGAEAIGLGAIAKTTGRADIDSLFEKNSDFSYPFSLWSSMALSLLDALYIFLTVLSLNRVRVCIRFLFK